MASIFSRIIGRRINALYLSILFGMAGVLVDFDHIICLMLDMGEFNLEKGEYGCRLFHGLFVPFGWTLLGIVLTCVVGLIFFMVYDSIRATLTNLLK